MNPLVRASRGPCAWPGGAASISGSSLVPWSASAGVGPRKENAMRSFDWKASRLCRALARTWLIPVLAVAASAQTPAPALLVLEKGDNSLAIVDPAALKILGRVPAGGDPHEIVVSPDGKLAYISNYGGLD